MGNETTMKELNTVFLDYVRRVTLIGGGAKDVNLMNNVRLLPTSINNEIWKWKEFGFVLNEIIAITRRKIGTVEDDGINDLTWDVEASDYAQTWIKQLKGLSGEIDKSNQMRSLILLQFYWKKINNEIDLERDTGLFRMSPKINYHARDNVEWIDCMLNDLVNTVQTCDRVNQNMIPWRCGKGRWTALQKTLEAQGVVDAAFVDLKKEMRAAMCDTKLGSTSARTRAAHQILVGRLVELFRPDADLTPTPDARP